MDKNKWLDLQLFAGEGGEGGGEGAGTGVEAVDPGQQRLRELGVPASKITRRASEAVAKLHKGAESPKQEQKPTEQVAAADAPTEEKPKSRMSFQELMKDPEYNKEMQAVVQSRLRSAKGAEENMQKLAPALEVLARRHGMDPANMDYAALAEAVSSDKAYYEEMAMEMGVPVETAMKIDRQDRDSARQQRQEAITLEEKRFQDHMDSLERQAEAMKEVFPNFDLRAELSNPAFARMTSPSGGVPVKAAYYAIHHDELQKAAMYATANATRRQISNSIQANGRRPQENGTSGQAPSVTTFDYRTASKEQRKAVIEFMRREAAQGRKVTPSMVLG